MEITAGALRCLGAALIALPAILACAPAAGDEGVKKSASPTAIPRLEKSPDAWRALLSSDRFHILFEQGTEPAFSSPLNAEKSPGTYLCAACMLPLFESSAKYESGTGWPSFFRPLEGRLGTKRDFKLVVPRTEYHCIRCGGHQGHVFDDGPPPTGKRYCNNGLALMFVREGELLPPLRE